MAGIKRVKEYVGPAIDIDPDDLPKYERTGGYVLEPKEDGMWARLVVGNPAEGRPHQLKSRDATTPAVTGSNAGDLLDIALPLPEGTILVGELEAATQAAKKIVDRQGFRRLHLFDVPFFKGDRSNLAWDVRRELLEGIGGALSMAGQPVRDRFPVVPIHRSGFRTLYDEMVAEGTEGVVLKRVDSLYVPTRGDGKIDEWVRCKRIVTGDFVLCGLGVTGKLKETTGKWGLYKRGKLTEVMQARAPKELLVEENIGRLVAEFKGWARFKSGSLRHAQFVRVRIDKPALDCVPAAA